MPSFLNLLLAILAAYLLGSVPFALVASRLFGLADPRTYGSKNPGATNVLRSGHKGAAVLTLIGDAAKGWLAVFLAERWATDFALPGYTVGLVALAVFLGHLYPVFLRFKGGKGVATAAGVLLAIDLRLGLAWQTVMNDEVPYHEPMRLLTLVEASRARIEKLIARHEILQHFYHNEWVHLAALDPEDGSWYRYMPSGVWRRVRHPGDA
jgi:glycerol-3-phosphate acyltransferase PlsY